MNRKKNVLILTYYWPPGTSPGVQRFLKFAKYLPSQDWQPHVLTVRNGSYPNTDPSLLQDVPANLPVYRTKTIEPFQLYNILRGKKGKAVEVGMANVKNPDSPLKRFANYVRANFFIPDARKGWNHFAWKEAKRIIDTTGIDAVITTGPPHSTHLVGLQIREKFGIPWIADLRDPWTNIYYNQFLNRTHRSREKDQALENQVISTADCITVVSPGMRDEFKDRARNIQLIFNGYDPEDFVDRSAEPYTGFSLSYVGNLKPNQNIHSLWKVLKQLREDNQPFQNAFQLHLMGNIAPNVLDAIRKYHLDNCLQIHEFQPHDKAIQHMIRSAVLYLPIPQASNSASIITGKIFEYLATERPILGIGPENGDASHILRDADRSGMFGYDNHDGLKNHVTKLFKNWQKEGHDGIRITSNKYQQYSRQGMTQRLAGLLDDLTNTA